MGFFRQGYWSGLPFPSPGDLPNQGIEPRSLALQADSLPTELPGKPPETLGHDYFSYSTASPLHRNLQVANFQRCEYAFACSITLFHVWLTLSHVCILKSDCAFVYFTVQYCIEYSSTVALFQAQDVWNREGRWNWIQQGPRTCAINVRHEWNCRLASISHRWWSFSSIISHPLSFLPVHNPSYLFTQCQPLYASCCIILLCFSRYCKIKNVSFILCAFFLIYIIHVRSITNLLQYSNIQLIVLVGCLDYLCWTYEKLDLLTHCWNGTCSHVRDLRYSSQKCLYLL